MLMTLILVYKAWEAPNKNHRHTELWLYLPKEQRPPEGYAQWAIATAMRETYLTFAHWTILVAIVMWVLALMFCASRQLAARSRRDCQKRIPATIWTSFPDGRRISALAGNLRTGRDRRPFAEGGTS